MGKISEIESYLHKVCEEKFAIAFFDNDVNKMNSPCRLYEIDETLLPDIYNYMNCVRKEYRKVFNQM